MEYAVQNMTAPIKLWEKIEINVGDGSGAGRYVSRVEDFAPEGFIISTPEFVSGDQLLRNGCACTVIITRKDAIYQFSSRITYRENRRGRVYSLTPPVRARRVQRRQFVRIELSRPLMYAVLPAGPGADPSVESLTWHESKTINISGGGILMPVHDEMTAGDRLLLRIRFFADVGLPLAVIAICRRTEPGEKSKRAGIEFLRADHLPKHLSSQQIARLPESVTFFDQTAQNKLVNYIFQEQVKLRQKGLL